MISSTRKPLETDLAAHAKAALIARHAELTGDTPLAWREDMPVRLPLELAQTPPDLTYCATLQDHEAYGIIEVKRAKNADLLAQVRRWINRTNYVWMAHAPGRYDNELPADLRKAGVGLIIIIGEVAEIVHGATFNPDADTRLIAQAFAQGSAEFDPPAGSAGVRRQTEPVSKWNEARTMITVYGPMRWRAVQQRHGQYRDVTEAQAVKAIKKNEFQGVDYDRTKSPTEFFSTEKQ